MSGYREWFRIAIEHAYHGGAGFTAWRAAPTAGTQTALERDALLVRQAPGLLSVFAPAAPDDAPDPGQPFEFLIVPTDPQFGGYTVPPARADHLLVADDGNAVREPSGAWRLHAGEYIGAEAFAPAAGDCAGAPRQAPLLVRIHPGRIDAAAGPQRYLVRFDAAATYWKYYLQGPLAGRAVSVVDADDAVTFLRTDEGEVGGRPAAVFLSDRAIALRDRPGQRFQLREQAAFGEKVLMKRLPVASTAGRTRASAGELAVLVSEIFVNF